jgi:dihydroxyacetone kinase-like predicted kinase
MKFHILYDEKTELYWLLNTQATDSMTRADKLPANRYNLPDNERHRLQLHFSKNCFDWCFACMVAKGESAKESRHYAAMAMLGDDLLIVSRSGNEKAQSAHNGNIITFHTVKNFRDLVY